MKIGRLNLLQMDMEMFLLHEEKWCNFKVEKRKIKYLLITGLDNILMKPIDEVPLGIMIDKGVKSIGKSIKKKIQKRKWASFVRKMEKLEL